MENVYFFSKKAIFRIFTTIMLTGLFAGAIKAQSYNVTLPESITFNGLTYTCTTTPNNPIAAGTTVTVRITMNGIATQAGYYAFLVTSNTVDLTLISASSYIAPAQNQQVSNSSREFTFVMPNHAVTDLVMHTPFITPSTGCSIGPWGFPTLSAALESITDNTPTTIVLRSYNMSINNMTLTDRNIILDFGSCLGLTLMGDVSLTRSRVECLGSNRITATGTLSLDEDSYITLPTFTSTAAGAKSVIDCKDGSTISVGTVEAQSLPVSTPAVKCDNGNVMVNNRLTCSGNGIVAENGGTASIYKIIAGGAFGVHCSQGSSVTVEESVITNSEDAVGVFCTDEGSAVYVGYGYGGITAETGTGVKVKDGGEVTIKGEITAPTYIVIDDISYTAEQYIAVSSKPDYLEYTNRTSYVWIYIKVPVTITTETLPNGYVGEPYSYTMQATGKEPLYWEFWVDGGDYPDWLILDEETGVLSGTPTETGVYTIWIGTWNDNYAWDEKEFTITVTPPAAPIITTETLQNGAVGTAYSETLEATGSGTIIWTLEEGNLPGGLELSANGTISGMPTTIGTFDFIVKAANNLGHNMQELSIVIEDETGVADITSPQITIYPNPTSYELRIDGVAADYSIFNVMGQIVMQGNLSGNSINVSSLASGIYYLKISGQTLKFIKE